MERRLNVGESFLWTGGVDSFTIAVGMTIRGELAVEDVRKAIGKARQKHPLMGVRVAIDKENKPWFVSGGVPDNPLRVVTRESDNDVAREIKNELATPIAWETGPLVRFVLVRSAEVTDLLVVCHHCVTDGIGIAILVRDIFGFLLDPQRSVEAVPDQPPLEEILPDFVKPMLPRARKSKKQEQNQFLDLTPAQLDAKHTNPKLGVTGNLQFYSWELAEEKTTALLARCRQESVRVHSALCAAFGLGGTFKTIANAVNLRNRLAKPIGDRFGSFATTIYTTLRTRPELGLWDVARHYQKQFERHLKNVNGWVILLPAIPTSLGKEFESTPEVLEKDTNALIISNVGDLSAFSQVVIGKWHLEKVIGAGVVPNFASPWLGFATIGGKIWFNLIYWDEIMSEPTIKEIVTKAMDVITKNL